MEIDDILKNFGQLDKTEPCKWDEVVRPKASYLLTGDVGTGKSALAYFILERYSQAYGLTPTVVGLPKTKRTLLPGNFDFIDSMEQIQSKENAVVFIDEADIQLPLDSNKNKETVVNFLSLPRQRKQIFILAYHFPRLVKGTYLPFFSAFLFKRPPFLLEFASKKGSDEILRMMTKAAERFDEMPSEDDVVKNTYVIAPRIRWQGLLSNGLPSFWSQELSEIWSGTKIENELKLFEMENPPGPQRRRWVTAPEEIEARPAEFGIEPIYENNIIVGFTILDPEGEVIRQRAKIVTLLHNQYPGVSVAELQDSAISYFDYRVEVALPRRV